MAKWLNLGKYKVNWVVNLWFGLCLACKDSSGLARLEHRRACLVWVLEQLPVLEPKLQFHNFVIITVLITWEKKPTCLWLAGSRPTISRNPTQFWKLLFYFPCQPWQRAISCKTETTRACVSSEVADRSQTKQHTEILEFGEYNMPILLLI